jgi:enoyl-[acyl-carrier-protein] reductase (NADH)
MGRVDEIGSAAGFLASGAESLRAGSIVWADGGYSYW